MERFKKVTYDDVIMRNDGLAKAVCDRAVDYIMTGVAPFESYEELVDDICSDLRSWLRNYVWLDVDVYVGFMAKAFIQFIIARYGFKEIKKYSEEENVLDKINEGEFEDFSDCLLADTSRKMVEIHSSLIGMNELIKKEKKNKK